MYAKSTRPSAKREVQKDRSAKRDDQIARPIYVYFVVFLYFFLDFYGQKKYQIKTIKKTLN